LEEQLKAFNFGHITDSSLFGGKKAGDVDLHKDGEDSISYDQSSGLSTTEWILSEGFPIVDELSQDSWGRALGTGKDLLSVFGREKTGTHFDAALAVAKANKGKFVVTYSTNIDIASRWGSSGKVVPTAIYVKNNAGQPSFINWDEDTEGVLDATTLAAFVDSSRDGSYKSYVKSEPIPESNDGPVTVVVGKEFDSIVLSNKDVLIEFYAPWCGHCQKLAPVYEELGASYKDDANVVIAKMDATANAVPSDMDVRGYPTIVFVDAKNEIKVFESGERDFDSLREFIEANRVSEKGTEKEDL